MPQLTLRGISLEKIKTISTAMVEELANVCGCETDNFTIDCLQVTSLFAGHLVETYPFVEVAWFDRGKKVRDRFAATVTRHLWQTGIAEVEVAFKVYREDAYYVNGEPCVVPYEGVEDK